MVPPGLEWRPGKEATPAGGRTGVADRSGSGGVEPVPFQKKASTANQSMAKDCGGNLYAVTPVWGDTNSCCPINSSFVEE